LKICNRESIVPFQPDIGLMPDDVRKLLAPSGVLRAGINMSNFLLVSSRSPDGGPAGVSPDLASAIAAHLGLPIQYVVYPNPGVLADAALKDEWDIALIGAEPQRAEVISFTPAYSEIEATYLVPAGSKFQSIEEVDSAGTRIAVAERTAYGLWLDRNIQKAELVHARGLDGSFKTFLDVKADALAGLRPRLIDDVKTLPGARVLEGRFMAVQQAVGVPKPKHIAIDHLIRFVGAARTRGFIADLIRKHAVNGLSVA
jgi:polar amino acid transport system substrate-binding protein